MESNSKILAIVIVLVVIVFISSVFFFIFKTRDDLNERIGKLEEIQEKASKEKEEEKDKKKNDIKEKKKDELVEVPDVEGLSVDEAIRVLMNEGFVVDENYKSKSSSSIDSGKVVSTIPLAGSKRERGTVIVLYIAE